MRRNTFHRATRVFGALLITAGSAAAASPTRAAHAATAWTGTVFEDSRPDGKRGDAELEPGIAGVTVTAFSADATTTATATSGPDGRFNIAPPGPGPYRLEYTNIPSGYVIGRRLEQANRTGQAGAEVRHVADTGAPLDLALVRPGQTCQQDPDVAFTCFISGHASGGSAGERTLGTAPSSRAGWYATGGYKPPTQLANHNQTGATYGVAWQPSSNSLFTSAFVKRFSGLGPGGIGAIYRSEAVRDRTPANKPGTAPSPGSLFIDLAAVAGLAPLGTDPHPPAPGGDWFHDAATYPLVGRIGLGDIDVSVDGRTLYATNLNSRQLLAIPIRRDGTREPTLTGAPADQPPGPNQIGQFTVPSPCNNPDEWRIFAVAPRVGDVLVGGTCTLSSQVAVLSFDPGPRTWSKPVLSFAVNFPRGRNGYEASWEGWKDDETKAWNRSQLFLSDISTDGDDLVLGVRDRYGDMTGKKAGTTNVNSDETYSGGILGELLRACANADRTGWVLETNGTCGARATNGANNQDGPGGGEYYWKDDFRDTGKITPDQEHMNDNQGGIAVIPGSGLVASGLMDPYDYFSSGVGYFDNTTGVRNHGYETTPQSTRTGFGKANGIGDIEALCNEGVLEIGDRVWLDSNDNGIQDPAEPPIPGVKVELRTSTGQVLGTAVTSFDGSYLFTNAPGKGSPYEVHTNALEPLVPAAIGYQLRIPPGQPVLQAWRLTSTHAKSGLEASAAGELGRDNDGALENPAENNGGIETGISTGLPGTGDHAHDFGYVAPAGTPAPRGAAPSPPTAEPATSVGTQPAAPTAPAAPAPGGDPAAPTTLPSAPTLPTLPTAPPARRTSVGGHLALTGAADPNGLPLLAVGLLAFGAAALCVGRARPRSNAPRRR